MAEIVTKFSSDDKEMIAAFQRQQKEIDKLKGKLREVKEGADNYGVTTEAAAKKIMGGIANIVSGYVGVAAAIGTINRALQDQLDLQDKVAGAQRTAADAEIKFLRNLGNVSKEEREKTLKDIAAISQRTGVNQASIYQMASTAVSAKGGLSTADALRAVEQAARIAPEDVGEGTAIAGGLLDVASLTGTADPKRNMGLLIQMQQQARLTNLQSVSRHLVPGAISMKSYGATAEEGAAATTSMTQAMKDPEGAISSTAMIALAAQAEGVTKGGFGEDIAKLRSDTRLRDRFLKKASFERKAQSFIKDFLTEGTEVSKLYDQFKGQMPTAEKAAGTAAEFEEGIGGTPLQQSEAFRRKFETEANARRIADIRSGSYSRIRGAIEDVSSAAGVGYVDRTMGAAYGRIAGFARDPESAGIVQIGAMQGDIERNAVGGSKQAREDAKAQIDALNAIKFELMSIRKSKEKNINAQIE